MPNRKKQAIPRQDEAPLRAPAEYVLESVLRYQATVATHPHTAMPVWSQHQGEATQIDERELAHIEDLIDLWAARAERAGAR